MPSAIEQIVADFKYQGLREAASHFELLARSMQKIDLDDRSIARWGLYERVLIGAGTAAATAAARIIDMASDLQQATIAFSVFTKSTSEASQHLRELMEFSAKTPFQYTQWEQASRTLQAYGMQVEEVKSYLRSIGDIASATGSQLEFVADAFAQIKVGNVGVGLATLRAYGVPTAMVQKHMAAKYGYEGDIYQASPTMVLRSVSAVTGDRYGGLMEKQMQTLEGSMSNLVDNITIFGREVGKVLVRDLTPMVQKITYMVKALNQMSDVSKAIFGKGLVGGAVAALVGLAMHYARVRAGILELLTARQQEIQATLASTEAINNETSALERNTAAKAAAASASIAGGASSQKSIPANLMGLYQSGAISQAASEMAAMQSFRMYGAGEFWGGVKSKAAGAWGWIRSTPSNIRSLPWHSPVNLTYSDPAKQARFAGVIGTAGGVLGSLVGAQLGSHMVGGAIRESIREKEAQRDLLRAHGASKESIDRLTEEIEKLNVELAAKEMKGAAIGGMIGYPVGSMLGSMAARMGPSGLLAAAAPIALVGTALAIESERAESTKKELESQYAPDDDRIRQWRRAGLSDRDIKARGTDPIVQRINALDKEKENTRWWWAPDWWGSYAVSNEMGAAGEALTATQKNYDEALERVREEDKAKRDLGMLTRLGQYGTLKKAALTTGGAITEATPDIQRAVAEAGGTMQSIDTFELLKQYGFDLDEALKTFGNKESTIKGLKSISLARVEGVGSGFAARMAQGELEVAQKQLAAAIYDYASAAEDSVNKFELQTKMYEKLNDVLEKEAEVRTLTIAALNEQMKQNELVVAQARATVGAELKGPRGRGLYGSYEAYEQRMLDIEGINLMQSEMQRYQAQYFEKMAELAVDPMERMGYQISAATATAQANQSLYDATIAMTSGIDLSRLGVMRARGASQEEMIGFLQGRLGTYNMAAQYYGSMEGQAAEHQKLAMMYSASEIYEQLRELTQWSKYVGGPAFERVGLEAKLASAGRFGSAETTDIAQERYEMASRKAKLLGERLSDPEAYLGAGTPEMLAAQREYVEALKEQVEAANEVVRIERERLQAVADYTRSIKESGLASSSLEQVRLRGMGGWRGEYEARMEEIRAEIEATNTEIEALSSERRGKELALSQSYERAKASGLSDQELWKSSEYMKSLADLRNTESQIMRAQAKKEQLSGIDTFRARMSAQEGQAGEVSAYITMQKAKFAAMGLGPYYARSEEMVAQLKQLVEMYKSMARQQWAAGLRTEAYESMTKAYEAQRELMVMRSPMAEFANQVFGGPEGAESWMAPIVGSFDSARISGMRGESQTIHVEIGLSSEMAAQDPDVAMSMTHSLLIDLFQRGVGTKVVGGR